MVGVLPQNDIPKLQKQLAGKDDTDGEESTSIVDRADSTEEERYAGSKKSL